MQFSFDKTKTIIHVENDPRTVHGCRWNELICCNEGSVETWDLVFHQFPAYLQQLRLRVVSPKWPRVAKFQSYFSINQVYFTFKYVLAIFCYQLGNDNGKFGNGMCILCWYWYSREREISTKPCPQVSHGCQIYHLL